MYFNSLCKYMLTVGFCDTLQLVLLLDGIRVGRSLGGVDQLVSKTLSNGLDVPEASFSRSCTEEPHGLIDSPQGSNIDSLSSNCTSTPDTCGIFTRTTVDDGVAQHLKGIFTSQQMNNLESMLDNSDSHQLLAIIPPVHHQGVSQTLHDGALRLSEALLGVPSSRMRQKDSMLLLDSYVVSETDVADLHLIWVPPAEQFNILHLDGGGGGSRIICSPFFFSPVFFSHCILVDFLSSDC